MDCIIIQCTYENNTKCPNRALKNAVFYLEYYNN